MAAIEFAGLETEIAEQLRLDTAKANQKAAIDRWINLTLEDIHGRADWFWTRERQVIQTVIDKTAGTVAVSISGTTVTGTSTAFASADVGKFIQFAASDDWYKITAVDSATSLTIEIEFNGTAALTTSTYIIRQFYYSLPSAEKVLTVSQKQTPRKLNIGHIRDFDTRNELAEQTRGPEDFFLWGLNSSNQLQFLVYPWPDEARNLEIRYKKKCTEDSISYFPEKWRHVILDGALVRGLKYVALGNPSFDRGAITLQIQQYEAGVAKMLADMEPESDSSSIMQNCEVAITPSGPDLPKDYA